ncbi:sigma-E factor negative regulatory protein [Ideonella sp. BN130291]|uniref:sigma-E factor negative regulatory protein n=1 Tax=Ideonella sp. BN130291 TaxID=3112940 RepID=UPI002E26CD2B|nr:sigma-E factor negative regulatory protein [Ideonella sp. BN130291]
MSDDSVDASEPRRALSALTDGELDAAAVQRACAAWREDATARGTWHTYHLIGDVLRSDDLAVPAQRDDAFLAALRARLAQEPVVLAPASVTQPAALPAAPAVAPLRRRAWAAPLAVAAGFVAVAGVLAVTQVAGPVGAPPSGPLATLAPGQGAVAAVAVQPAGADRDSGAPGADAKLIRDVHLDRYLAAHKQFGSTAAVSVPGVRLRNAATYAPER